MNLLQTSSPTELVTVATDAITRHITMAIETRGECTIGLSGGSTPKPVYEALATQAIDWTHVTLFLLDERYLPPGNADSNATMVREYLLDRVSPAPAFLAPDTSLPIDECVMEYENHLKELLRASPADVIILGMGDDGHTASLFPPLGEDALGHKTVIHVTQDRIVARDRISVTLPILHASTHRFLLLSGDAKRQAWEAMQASTEDEHRWPLKALMDDRMTVITQW